MIALGVQVEENGYGRAVGNMELAVRGLVELLDSIETAPTLFFAFVGVRENLVLGTLGPKLIGALDKSLWGG